MEASPPPSFSSGFSSAAMVLNRPRYYGLKHARPASLPADYNEIIGEATSLFG